MDEYITPEASSGSKLDQPVLFVNDHLMRASHLMWGSSWGGGSCESPPHIFIPNLHCGVRHELPLLFFVFLLRCMDALANFKVVPIFG